MRIKLYPLDKLFSRYIRARDKVCQRCGCYSKYLQTSHFHGRRKQSVRWNEDNCCLLCFGCHMYFHSHPVEHTEFFQKRLGEEKFELLHIQAQMVGVRQDKETLALYLKEKLKEVDNGS